MAVETLEAARDAVARAFGVLPALFNPATTGPLVREAQRHLAGWTLQPIAALLAEEASAKLGAAVEIDVMRRFRPSTPAAARGRWPGSSRRWRGEGRRPAPAEIAAAFGGRRLGEVGEGLGQVAPAVLRLREAAPLVGEWENPDGAVLLIRRAWRPPGRKPGVWAGASPPALCAIVPFAFGPIEIDRCLGPR